MNEPYECGNTKDRQFVWQSTEWYLLKDDSTSQGS